MKTKRGILLVANKASEILAKNLLYSIKTSGCKLPIKIIHFGGKKITNTYILDNAEYITIEDFPIEAQQFINDLHKTITDCPKGFLYRYLAFFLDWDEFLYSDNDVVALCNWEHLFDYLKDADLVHADEEYLTEGIFNYNNPEKIKEYFGNDALLSAITAGHFMMKNNKQIILDIYAAIKWVNEHTGIAKFHDQALLHIASLIGNWKIINLCKDFNWLSSWAGDYANTLKLVQKIQENKLNISHIHYSGGNPTGTKPIDDFLFSDLNEKERLNKLNVIFLKRKFFVFDLVNFFKKVIHKFKSIGN